MRYGLILPLAAIAAVIVSPADAGRRVADGGFVDFCDFSTMPTDGSLSINIGTYDTNCGSTPTSAFSVNIGGTTYSSLFVNENGIISFGAPITAGTGTPLGSLTTPAFAPFFADGQINQDGSRYGLQYGWTDSSFGFPDSFWVTYSNFTPQGDPSASPNIFQVGLVDIGGGDFDLIFNYEVINWDMSAIGAQAGVVTSLNNAFLLNGAFIPGAYLGSNDSSSGADVCTSATPATALACNKINDGSQVVGGLDFNTNLPANGYYLFKFRSGVLTSPPINEVPIPAAFGLFALGLAAFASKRLMHKQRA